MYGKQEWRNGDEKTPISGERLNHIEDGIAGIAARVEVLPEPRSKEVSVSDLVRENRAGLVASHPYADPTADQVMMMLTAVDTVLRGATPTLPAGVELIEGWDADAMRNVRVLRSTPGNGLYWGMWVLPDGVPLAGVVEAPHPVFDADSDDIATSIWQRSPNGTVLAVAGSHRTNANGLDERDAAHNTKSMWHQVTTHIAQPGLPELQLHGFGDESMPGVGAVVSSGSSPLSAGVVRAEGFIAAAGVPTARQWDGTATKLIGMSNIQGDAAAVRGSPFGHVELSKTTRDDPRAFVDAVVASGFFGGGHGALLTNAFPTVIGSVNSRGTATTAARADHAHRMTQNDPTNGDVVMRQSNGWRAVPVSELGISAGGYQKPADGIPLSDLAQKIQDLAALVEQATYSATSETLMRRTKTGAASVGDATAGAHAVNKKQMDAALSALASKLGTTYP